MKIDKLALTANHYQKKLPFVCISMGRSDMLTATITLITQLATQPKCEALQMLFVRF